MKNFQTIKISKELRLVLGALRKIYAQLPNSDAVKFLDTYFDWSDPNVLYCFADDIGRDDHPTVHPVSNLVDLQSDLIPAKTESCQKVMRKLERGAVWTSGAKEGKRVDWKGTTLSDSVFCFFLFQIAATYNNITLPVPSLIGQEMKFCVVQQSWSGDQGEARFRYVTINFGHNLSGFGDPICHSEPMVSVERKIDRQNQLEAEFEPDDYDEYER